MKKVLVVLAAGAAIVSGVWAADPAPPKGAPAPKEQKPLTETQKRRLEIQTLCRQYRSLPEAQRAVTKTKIMELLKSDYEFAQADRLKRIENLEKQLAKLKEDQSKNREEIIDAEFERLIKPPPPKKPAGK